MPIALLCILSVTTEVFAVIDFSVLQSQLIMPHEVRPNSICNLPGYQREDSYFACFFRDLEGFDVAI